MKARTFAIFAVTAAIIPIQSGASASASGRRYAAFTSQGNPLVIQLAGRQVTEVDAFIHADCVSGLPFSLSGPITLAGGAPTFVPGKQLLFGGRIDKRGVFTATTRVDLGGDFSAKGDGQIGGKLGRDGGSGLFQAHIDINDPQHAASDVCNADLTWKAPSPQSLYYGGRTSTPGEPVVLRLRKDRKQVAAFHIVWSAACSQGAFSRPDELDNFKIGRRGKFGDAFTVREPDGQGGSLTTDYQLRGKVGRTSAAGTFKGHVTFIDSAGAVTDSCDSGLLRWSLRH